MSKKHRQEIEFLQTEIRLLESEIESLNDEGKYALARELWEELIEKRGELRRHPLMMSRTKHDTHRKIQPVWKW